MSVLADPMTRAEAVRFCQLNHGLLSPRVMVEHLTARGYPVGMTTVRGWADPEYGDQHRANNAERKRRQRLMGRMRELREAGVTYSCIARVMTLDFGIRVTEEQVRYALRVGRPGQSLAKSYREALREQR